MTAASKTRPTQSGGVWATFRESPLAVKILLVGVFVSRLSGFLNIFVVLYLTARGYSAQQAAVALGVYGAGTVVGVLVGGSLADRLGARKATVLSMTSAAVLTAALLYLPTYSSLLAAVALVGLLGQIYRPASATLLSELTPESRQVMIFAMYRFGMNVGAMAAPLLGFGLYHLNGQGYALLFWGEAFIALAYALLAQATLPARAGAPTGAGAVEGAPAAGGGYLAVLRDGRFTLFLVGSFFMSALYVQYLSTLPLDITASGLPIFWYTLALSLNGFTVILFELLVTKVVQRWPMRLTVGLSVALLGTGMAIYGLPLLPAVIIAGTLIWTAAEIVGAPSTFAYPAVAGPAHRRGRYIGSFQFMFGLGAAVGPIAGGILFARLGHGVWPVLATAAVVAFALMVPGVRSTPHRGAPADSDPAGSDPGSDSAGSDSAGGADGGPPTAIADPPGPEGDASDGRVGATRTAD
jgi:MFS family permease